jgi:hypothetical protein
MFPKLGAEDLDLFRVVAPFLEVVRCETTSGPITGVALSSINKFLEYNLPRVWGRPLICSLLFSETIPFVSRPNKCSMVVACAVMSGPPTHLFYRLLQSARCGDRSDWRGRHAHALCVHGCGQRRSGADEAAEGMCCVKKSVHDKLNGNG